MPPEVQLFRGTPCCGLWCARVKDPRGVRAHRPLQGLFAHLCAGGRCVLGGTGVRSGLSSLWAVEHLRRRLSSEELSASCRCRLSECVTGTTVVAFVSNRNARAFRRRQGGREEAGSASGGEETKNLGSECGSLMSAALLSRCSPFARASPSARRESQRACHCDQETCLSPRGRGDSGLWVFLGARGGAALPSPPACRCAVLT